MQLNLMFGKQVDVYPDFTLRTEWDDHLSTFLVKDFNVNIDGMNVKSEITEISSAPESPVTVDVATYSDPISPLGGTLYFIRDVINTAPNLIEIKRWAYITWPDGTHYNHNSPKKVILDPMDQDIQTSAYFNVPSYWPSGTYEYHLNSIVVKGGLDEEGTVSHDSFTFIKD